MRFGTNFSFTVKTFVVCPKCGEKFEKPKGSKDSPGCPRCGEAFSISGLSNSDSNESTEAARAAEKSQKRLSTEADGAKTYTLLLNAAGVIAAVWAAFFPRPYKTAILVCALIPAVSIWLMSSMKGRISFETLKKKTRAPYLTFALIAPGLALSLRSIYDFHVLSFSEVLLPVSIVSIVFSVLLYRYSSDISKKPGYIFVALFFGFIYGYGAVIEANCLLDGSYPETYTATVLDKRTHFSSGSDSHYIKVTPWGPRNEEHEISIKKRGFNLLSKNDTINIYLRSGFLGIQWYVIGKKR